MTYRVLLSIPSQIYILNSFKTNVVIDIARKKTYEWIFEAQKRRKDGTQTNQLWIIVNPIYFIAFANCFKIMNEEIKLVRSFLHTLAGNKIKLSFVS